MAGVIPWRQPPESVPRHGEQYPIPTVPQNSSNFNLVTGINPGQYPFDFGQGFGGVNHNFMDQMLFESTDLVGELVSYD